MATDDGRLFVLFEARLKDFEKAQARMEKTTNSLVKLQRGSRSATRQMEQDVGRMTSRINAALAGTSARMGAFGKSFALGLAGAAGVGIGIPAAISAVTGAVSDLAKMAADARMAGLGAETFQELKYAADQSKVGVDALADGMKELQLRADEFVVTGKGSAAEAFQRIGLTPQEVKERLKDPADLLNEIMNRVGKLSTAARIRILDELFGGTAGEQFIRFLDQGRDGISVLRQEARETGNVLAQDVIKRAEEIDRRFGELSRTVGTQLKGAIVEAADALLDFLNLLPGAKVPIEDIGKRSLEITREIMQVERTVEALRKNDAHTGTSYYASRIKFLEQYIEKLKAEDALLQKRGQAAVDARDRKAAFQPPATGGDYRGGANVADTTAKTQSAFDRLSESIAKRTQLLGVEAQMIDKTQAVRERARIIIELETAARRANKEAGKEDIEVTDAQREKIEQLANAYGNAYGKLEALNGPMASFAREAGNVSLQLEQLAVSSLDRMSDTLVDVMQGTKDTATAFKEMAASIIADLAKIMIRKAFAGVLGSLGFSEGGIVPGYATGGVVRGPGTGTSDSIPARLSNGEFVVNAAATSRHRPLLEAINRDRVQGFAAGGYVASPRSALSASAPRSAGAQPVNIKVDVTGARGNTEIQDMVEAGVRLGIKQFAGSQEFQARTVKAVRMAKSGLHL